MYTIKLYEEGTIGNDQYITGTMDMKGLRTTMLDCNKHKFLECVFIGLVGNARLLIVRLVLQWLVMLGLDFIH